MDPHIHHFVSYIFGACSFLSSFCFHGLYVE